MEDLLISRIVDRVIEKILEMTRKKVLVLVRKEDINNINKIEDLVELVISMGIDVHISYECIKDENLYTRIYCRELSQVDFPKNVCELENLLDKNYEFVIVNYLRLGEIKDLSTLDIRQGFTPLIFNIIYKNLGVFTNIYELNGPCMNPALKTRIEELTGFLKDMNINILPDKTCGSRPNTLDPGRSGRRIDKKVVSMEDLYNLENCQIDIKSDTIITAMAEDYIRDKNILVRRR